MPTIAEGQNVQTVLTTFETNPGMCSDLLAALSEAYRGFIRRQPGFVGAAIHVNDAQTRIANYAQWESREAFLRMLRSEEMRAHTRRFAELSRSFEPVMYEVAETLD